MASDPAGPARFVPAPVALAMWLAVPLVGAKIVHWSWPGARWGDWPDWFRDVGVSAHSDVAFAAAFGLVAFVLLRLTRRWPRLERGLGIGLLALGTFCVFYAVASVQMFAFLRSPLTYPLLYLAGDVKSMRSSIGSFLSPAFVAALVLVPLLHVLAVRLTSRPRRAHSWPLASSPPRRGPGRDRRVGRLGSPDGRRALVGPSGPADRREPALEVRLLADRRGPQRRDAADERRLPSRAPIGLQPPGARPRADRKIPQARRRRLLPAPEAETAQRPPRRPRIDGKPLPEPLRKPVPDDTQPRGRSRARPRLRQLLRARGPHRELARRPRALRLSVHDVARVLPGVPRLPRRHPRQRAGPPRLPHGLPDLLLPRLRRPRRLPPEPRLRRDPRLARPLEGERHQLVGRRRSRPGRPDAGVDRPRSRAPLLRAPLDAAEPPSLRPRAGAADRRLLRGRTASSRRLGPRAPPEHARRGRPPARPALRGPARAGPGRRHARRRDRRPR